MGTSKFSTVNYLNSTATSLTTGTGGAAPARDESSPHVMERALTRDRWQPWLTAPTPASPIYFDVDLGSARSVGIAATLGMRPSAVAAMLSVELSSSSTAGYPRTWTSQGTWSLVAGPRDAGLQISPVSARYWRFAITNTAQFSIGKLWLGTVVDLGAAHAPGADASPVPMRTEVQAIGGAMLIEQIGDPGRSMSIPIPECTDARRNVLESLGDLLSFLYVDPMGSLFEVTVPGGRVAITRQFVSGSSSLCSVNVPLVRLP